MSVLSVQSHVAYGHVGNSAAVFPLQRLGLEVWPVHTVQFSNHTGYGSWRGQVFSPDHVAQVLDGIAERDVLPHCDAVLSGYLGDAAIGRAVLGAVERVRAANPRALWCCDPVMGDAGRGLFVRHEVAAFLAERAVPAADVVTPNQFELERLVGGPIATIADAVAATRALRRRGPSLVLLTSLRRSDAPAGIVETFVNGPSGCWRVATPYLECPEPLGGAGDALAALFLGRLLGGHTPPEAMSLAVSSLHAVLVDTLRRGARELQLIAAQQALVTPPRLFPAEAVG